MKFLFLFLVLFLSSACGALKLNPSGCSGSGVWGSETGNVEFVEEYYVWNADHEVRLKEFLKQRNLDCHEIKKIRVKVTSKFFVKRELTVFVYR
ncbi:MAG: hypothetical protein Q7U04_17335 [Bacteriovorax sp.]|nr:hypothetical protein [Bacteriovorax sp.]